MENIEKLLEGELALEVVNFMKHNPKKTNQWFKLRNDWFQDPRLASLPPVDRYVFVVLCSLRADSGVPLYNFSIPWLQHRCNMPGTSIRPILVRLCKKGLISLEKNRKERKEEIREEETDPKKPDLLLVPQKTPDPPPPTKEISSSPSSAGGGLFSLFEEIPRTLLRKYEVSERGLQKWVDLWGVAAIAANIVPCSHKFETGANLKNPYYRQNFGLFFVNWMENNVARKAGAKQRQIEKELKSGEDAKWKVY